MKSGTAAQPALRIDYVDGLRALAVLGVILHHVAKHAGAGAQSVLHEGAHGVDLFFVISGFCLAFPTLAKLRGVMPVRFNIADFGAKRLVRIVPPFYLATLVLIAFIALPHILTRHQLPPAGWFPDARNIVASLLSLDDRVSLVNGSFWTLMVEFRWYFAFPVLLWLWVRSPRGFVAAGIASLILYHFTRARGLDFGTLPGFMLGIVAADLHVGGPHTARWGAHFKRWAWLVAVAGIALGVASEGSATIPGIDRGDVTFAYQPTIFGWQLACFALVVFAGANAAFRRVLSLKPLIATGIASYGIYLVHEPVIATGMARLGGLGGALISGALALAAGFAFWAVCEVPFTTGPLRAPLLARIRPVLERVLGVAGVARTILIRPAQLREVVAEDYVSSRVAVAAPSSPT